MENIKHRKFTIGSLTSLACFNVIRQKWAAKGAFSWGSCSSCCRLTLPRMLFCRNLSWHKKAKAPLETLIFMNTVMGKMSLIQGLLTIWFTWELQMWVNLKQGLLEAIDPTLASSSDEVFALQHPFAHLESAVHAVIPSHILLIFSKDYFQLNLREEYSKIECITVRNMS